MNDVRSLAGHPSNLNELSADEEIGLFDLVGILLKRWIFISGGALLCGIVALGIAFLIRPTFTARTSILPPLQQQSSAIAAISQLGALAGVSGAGGMKSPADQYASILQSDTVLDRVVEEFKLMEIYEVELRQDAREQLGRLSRASVGKKDGLITLEVDDHDPQRAANMANAFVETLRLVLDKLAVSEAQQRRAFFDEQLQQTKINLTKAQIALQGSGINQGTLKAEPRTAAEGYAKLRAEATAAEVRLQTMRQMLTDGAPELQQQQATLSSLREQLARIERRENVQGDSDYITKYREFKYQETLFELFARQYELARVDESREGALIQVLDVATPPERKSKPKRGLIAVVATLFSGLVLSAWVLIQDRRRRSLTPIPIA